MCKNNAWLESLGGDPQEHQHRKHGERERRVRGITVLSEDWADKPQFRDCDKYDDSPINHALHGLADRMHQGHRDWLAEMMRDPDESSQLPAEAWRRGVQDFAFAAARLDTQGASV
jgi:hypothetical protein